MAYPRAAMNMEASKMGQFKIIKPLGKGSYGKVYKVQRESDEQYYALKEMDLGTMSQLERADAVNEVRLLVSIGHPNVIRYHEAFLNGNKLCVIMEYAPFGDLKYYIDKGRKLNAPFPEEAIWRIFLQLCRGLAAVHSNNVIHRDIKPANIFLCANDLLKIGDLGVAKALTHMKFAQTQIGTPCYMAPEVWSGRPYSLSSDLFSLGCVLYEMMTFRVPFEGRTMQELKMRICACRYTPVPANKYSQELTAFCHALLSLEPRRRPSIDSILNSAAGQKWMRVLPTPPPAPLRRANSEGGDGLIRAPSMGKQLMDTIVVPRDLRLLPQKLPPPSYDSDVAPAKDVAPRAAVAVAAASGAVRPQRSASDNGCEPSSNPNSRPNSRGVAPPSGRAPSPALGRAGAPAPVALPAVGGRISANGMYPAMPSRVSGNGISAAPAPRLSAGGQPLAALPGALPPLNMAPRPYAAPYGAIGMVAAGARPGPRRASYS